MSSNINFLLESNKSICAKAWKEIYADNLGRYRLCCHADWTKRFSLEDEIQPFEYFLSDEIEDIRQKMIEGELIPECKTCHMQEKLGSESYRIKHSKTLWERGGFDDKIQGVTLKVRAFGSFCNLSCVMCHPQNSSERRRELNAEFKSDEDKEFLWHIGLPLQGALRFKKSEYDAYMQHILDHIHLVEKLQMMGGETLQLPKYWEFLEAIPKEHAKRITVGQETNLTQLGLGNKNVLDIADKFKQMYVGISVDHYGIKNEYLRYPVDQTVFENNLHTVVESGKVYYQLNATVSILNIQDLFDIHKYYFDKFDTNITFHNIVRGPGILSVRNLPQKMKDKYIEKYDYHFPFVSAELRRPIDERERWKSALTYLDRMYLYRGLDWRPLWQDLIDEVESYMR